MYSTTVASSLASAQWTREPPARRLGGLSSEPSPSAKRRRRRKSSSSASAAQTSRYFGPSFSSLSSANAVARGAARVTRGGGERSGGRDYGVKSCARRPPEGATTLRW